MRKQVVVVAGMIAVVLGTAIAVRHGFHAASAPPLEAAAVAQVSADNQVHVEPMPGTDADEGWSCFQVALPPHSPLLDLHVGLLIDNAGYELAREQPNAWPQSFLLKFKLDTNDDDAS